MIASEAISLIAPCTCCDKIRWEVRRLRELLATKLFENTLDKENRSVARTLLALTNARNLSFSLLRMVDISISLPFSFLSLIATYLIIMLQFEKVINPTGSNDNDTSGVQ
ncbi:hypothetical protein O0L34_g457 [Tuta absoluta]|nr:hypothetical protein O0L34_g457 [Tuta absoluta]